MMSVLPSTKAFGVNMMKGIKSGKIIGSRIKQRRRSLGLSQEKLAENLGVSYQQVQRYENGTNLLSTDKLQVVADFLAVPVGYLFLEDDRAVKIEVKYESREEAKLLRLYRNIDNRYKTCITTIIKLATK